MLRTSTLTYIQSYYMAPRAKAHSAATAHPDGALIIFTRARALAKRTNTQKHTHTQSHAPVRRNQREYAHAFSLSMLHHHGQCARTYAARVCAHV